MTPRREGAQTILCPDETVFCGLSSLPIFFLPTYERSAMRTKQSQKMYVITLTYPNNETKTVKVRATSRAVAESRALKRNPNADGVKYDA